MTDNPDAIGPNGTVRLRCYLPLENSLWFFAGCQGRAGCGHTAPISVKPDLDSAFRNVVSGEEVTAAVPAVCTTSSRKG